MGPWELRAEMMHSRALVSAAWAGVYVFAGAAGIQIAIALVREEPWDARLTLVIDGLLAVVAAMTSHSAFKHGWETADWSSRETAREEEALVRIER